MRFQKRKEKKEETKRCRFEAALFLLLLPLDVQQGKRSFFVFFPLSLLPRALEPKSDATHLMMRCPSSRALQATPPLPTTAGAVAEEVTCSQCTGDDGTGQGRPRSPCPYKYHPNEKKEREKEKR